MNFIFIISLLLFIVAVIIIIKFVKNVLYSILLILLFIVILSAAFGFYVIYNLNDPYSMFSGTTMIVLENNNTVLVATQLNNTSISVSPYSTSDKSLIIDIDAINDLNFDSVRCGDISLTKNQTIDILESDNPKQRFVSITNISKEDLGKELRKINLSTGELNDEDIRAAVFLMVLQQEFYGNTNPYYFFNEYKQGNLKLNPTPIPLHLIKIVPDRVFLSITKRFTP